MLLLTVLLYCVITLLMQLKYYITEEQGSAHLENLQVLQTCLEKSQYIQYCEVIISSGNLRFSLLISFKSQCVFTNKAC